MGVKLISYLLLLLLVLVTGVVRYKKLTTPFKILTLLIISTLLLEISAKICAVRFRNNLPVMHIISITQYLFYSFAYYHLFKNNIIRNSILASIFLFIIFFTVNSLLIQPYYSDFPSNAVLASEILYAIFSLLLFKQMLLYPLQVNIIKQSVFWYNTAMLFFSTTMFLNLGLINYFIKHQLNDLIVYDFTFVINMIFYLLIGISILIDNKEISTYNV